MKDLEAVAVLAEVPEGSIPEAGISIVAYLDRDGHQAVAWRIHGDPDMVTVAGLLTMAGHHLAHSD